MLLISQNGFSNIWISIGFWQTCLFVFVFFLLGFFSFQNFLLSPVLLICWPIGTVIAFRARQIGTPFIRFFSFDYRPKILLSMLEDRFASFLLNLNTPDRCFQSMKKIAKGLCCTTLFLTSYLPFLCRITCCVTFSRFGFQVWA